MAKDYFGTALSVGDKVAFVRNGYREFSTGTIIKINAKKATVEIKQGTTTQRYFSALIRSHLEAS